MQIIDRFPVKDPAIRFRCACSWPGCENGAEPNPADMENGPSVHDLADVLCLEHEAELALQNNLLLDMLGDMVRSGEITSEQAYAHYYQVEAA